MHNSCLKEWISKRNEVSPSTFMESLTCEICQNRYAMKFYKEYSYDEMSKDKAKFDSFKCVLYSLIVLVMLAGLLIYTIVYSINEKNGQVIINYEVFILACLGLFIILGVMMGFIMNLFASIYLKKWDFVDASDYKNLSELKIREL